MAGSQGLSARCLSAFAFLHFAVVRSEISCSDLQRISSNYRSCQADKDLEHSKLIVMLQVGDGYTDFFANWFRFANTYINRECMQILAIIDDRRTEMAMERLKRKHDWQFSTAMGSDFPVSNGKILLKADFKSSGGVPASLESKHPYGSEEYDASMSLRPRAINHFLSKDCTIAFSDIDLIWRKDIFSEILHQNKGGTANLYGFNDYKKDRPLDLCGGFMYMNPTPWTLSVVKKWSEKLNKAPGTNQGPLNDIIKSAIGGYRSMVFLPGATYLNPNTAVSQIDDQVSIVHANWLIGKASKKKFLKRLKLWPLHDDDDDYETERIIVGSSTNATVMTVDSTGDAETETNAATKTHKSTVLASQIVRHHVSDP